MGRRVGAASLAALAECGMAFLFVMEVSAEATRAAGGPLSSYPLFAALFVGGVAAGSLLREIRVYAGVAAAAAIALALTQGIHWGNGDPLGTAFLAVIMLLAALRVVTLVRRNWQDPVEGAFLAGTLVLLLEVIIAPSAEPQWQHVMPLVVGLFFVGSLGSRVMSLMVVDRPERSAGSASRGPFRAVLPVAFLAVFGGGLALATVLGGSNGLLQRLGGPLYSVFVAVMIGLGFVAAKLLLGPVNWLFSLFHFNLGFLRDLASRLSHLTAPASSSGHGHGLGPGWVERLLGLLVLAGVGFLLMRMIWRRLAALERDLERPEDRQHVESAEGGSRTWFGARRSFLRRELPADIVRRWYAEALVALERRGLDKPPAATPAEYFGDVARAFPISRSSFGALTRAYEDVRYGSLDVDRAVLRRLEEGRPEMMETFRRVARADEATEAVGDPGP